MGQRVAMTVVSRTLDNPAMARAVDALACSGGALLVRAARGCVWLAQCPEGRANFFCEELRLFPGSKVAAFVDLVVVDEVGVRLLSPAARGLIDLARKDAHASRDCDFLCVEEAERVVPVQTTRRNAQVRQ